MKKEELKQGCLYYCNLENAVYKIKNNILMYYSFHRKVWMCLFEFPTKNNMKILTTT